MSLWKRILRLVRWKAEDHVEKHEDAIRIYEESLQQSRQNIENIGDSIARLKAERATTMDKKKKAEEYVTKLERVMELAAEQKDYDLGERTLAQIESNERHREMHELAVQKYDGVIQELVKQHANLKESYQDKMIELDGLRAQDAFVKNMEVMNNELKLNYNTGDMDSGQFSKIEEELRTKIYYQQEKNIELAPKQDVMQIAKQSSRRDKFQQLVEKKEAERLALEAPESEKELAPAKVELAKKE